MSDLIKEQTYSTTYLLIINYQFLVINYLVINEFIIYYLITIYYLSIYWFLTMDFMATATIN